MAAFTDFLYAIDDFMWGTWMTVLLVGVGIILSIRFAFRYQRNIVFNFKNTYGKTIHQCILETRVEQAKFYIVNHPDMTLSTLATTLGFYDEFHLSRHFKAICGISPSAFRKQVHGNHDVEKQFHLKK
jgi:AraC-like DNA-binding protein